jgi:hypothetical protein
MALYRDDVLEMTWKSIACVIGALRRNTKEENRRGRRERWNKNA